MQSLKQHLAIGYFPTDFLHLAKQIQFARSNLLYISNGEIIESVCNVLNLRNAQPISNCYFKLCRCSSQLTIIISFLVISLKWMMSDPQQLRNWKILRMAPLVIYTKHPLIKVIFKIRLKNNS